MATFGIHSDWTAQGTRKPPLGLLPRSDHPHRTGLVGQWIMNEGSGLFLNDMSGNRNAGTIVGANWVAGKTDSALSFNGTTNYIDCGNNSSVLPNAFSFCCLVKPSTDTRNALVGWVSSEVSYPVIWCPWTISGNILMYMGSGNYRYFSANSPINVFDGGYHSLVFTIPGSGQTDITSAKLYVDGVEQNAPTTSSSGTQSAKTVLHIGRAYYEYLSATIGYSFLYNRALDPSEIQSLYMQPYAAWIPAKKYWVVAAGGTISFIADIQGTSETPSIAVKTARALTADIAGASTTSSITISTVRAIIANIIGISVTPSIDATTARSLSANIAGISTTPSVAAKLARALVANIVGTSTTPSITAIIEGIISWVASIAGVSTTPSIDVKIARSLSAAIAGTSVTSNVSAKIARALLADIQGTSITPDDLTLLLTVLIAMIDTTIESLTPIRTIESITPVYTIKSLTPVRTIEAI